MHFHPDVIWMISSREYPHWLRAAERERLATGAWESAQAQRPDTGTATRDARTWLGRMLSRLRPAPRVRPVEPATTWIHARTGPH
jgi:hypothetical protein